MSALDTRPQSDKALPPAPARLQPALTTAHSHPFRYEPPIFYLLLLLSLLPIWATPYFPSQDGPEHLHNAFVLLHLHTPGYEIFSSYYQLNPAVSPNWAGHLVLAGLMTFLPALIAEKIMLCAYLLAFPLAARYALGSIRPASRYLSVLAFPLAYNWFFHMGFYNFCFSLPVFLLAVGFYFRHRRSLTWRQSAALGGLLIGLYFCHLSGVIMAMGAIAGLALWTALIPPPSPAPPGPSKLDPFKKLAFAFAPVAALVIVFFFQNTGHEDISPALDLPARLKYWITFLCAFSRHELLFCLGILGILLLLLLAHVLAIFQKSAPASSPNRRDAAGLGLMVLGLILVSLLVPANIGRGGFVFHRLVLFTILLAFLYVGSLDIGPRIRLGTWLAAILLSLAVWGYYHHQYVRITDYVQEYVAAGQRIPAGKTVMPIGLPGTIELSLKTWPFRHAAGYLGSQSAIVDLDNYEAEVGYFPLIWRPAVNPFRLLRTPPPAADSPNTLDYARYNELAQGAGQIDYVLTWTCGLDAPPNDRSTLVHAWLHAHYDPIYTSPRGYAVLWRQKPSSDTPR